MDYKIDDKELFRQANLPHNIQLIELQIRGVLRIIQR